MGIFGSGEKKAKPPKEVKPTIVWQELEGVGRKYDQSFFRAKVPGGWFYSENITGTSPSVGVTFLPDPNHEWDGNSLK